MNVSFSDTAEFLDDLKYELEAEETLRKEIACTEDEAEVCRIDDRSVRVSLTKSKTSETSVDYTLAAGFTCLGELRQLQIHCGTDFLPSTDGSDSAKSMCGEIEQFCRDHSLFVRGGRFDES